MSSLTLQAKENLEAIEYKAGCKPHQKETEAQISRESFFCECGKKYLSYPALYVHARIKHNIKLTSKNNSKAWRMNENAGEKEKTFFLKYGKEN